MGTKETLESLQQRHKGLRPRIGGGRLRGSDTVRSLLLRAAGRLPQPFCLERLVVAAWQLDQQRFGLRGFEALYPDSNIVIANVAGKRGLVARRDLVKLGPKLYSLPFPTECA